MALPVAPPGPNTPASLQSFFTNTESTAADHETRIDDVEAAVATIEGSDVETVNGQAPVAGAVTVTATNVPSTATGDVAATNVQAAIAELASEKATTAALAAHEADSTAVHGIADTSLLLKTSDLGVTVQGYDADLAALAAAGNGAILAATTASFLTADETKLDGIEALADVTDATNVDAAGAVMNADSTTAGMAFVIDEDTMSSNLDTKVPTQQSVKAYADTKNKKLIIGTPARVNSTITLAANDNTWLNMPTIGTQVLAAVAGDMIEAICGWLWGIENLSVGVDIVTEVGGTPTNSLSTGGAAATGNVSGPAIASAFCRSTAGPGVCAVLNYVVQSGDLSGGNVTLRLRYRNNSITATQKTLGATTFPNLFFAKNLGQ